MEGVVKDDAERGDSGAGTGTVVDGGAEAALSRFTMVADDATVEGAVVEGMVKDDVGRGGSEAGAGTVIDGGVEAGGAEEEDSDCDIDIFNERNNDAASPGRVVGACNGSRIDFPCEGKISGALAS